MIKQGSWVYCPRLGWGEVKKPVVLNRAVMYEVDFGDKGSWTVGKIDITNERKDSPYGTDATNRVGLQAPAVEQRSGDTAD